MSIGVLTDLILTPLFEIIFRSPFIGVRLFTLVEFFLLTSYFFKITNINYKLLCYYFLITIFLLVFVYENFINFQNNFDSIATGVSALSILIYAILFLYYKLKQNQIIEFRNIDITITISLILYFAGTFFIYLLSKNNFFENYFQNYFTIINSIFIIIRNLLIICAFINCIKIDKVLNNKVKFNT